MVLVIQVNSKEVTTGEVLLLLELKVMYIMVPIVNGKGENYILLQLV